jgi:hypothetical protein
MTIERESHQSTAFRLRAHLAAVATRGLPITYRDAAMALQLTPPHTIRQIAEVLEQLMAEDAAADRPFIAALVISRVHNGMPAPRFFELAANLGRFEGNPTGTEAWVFHAAELKATLDYWTRAAH